GSNNLASGQWAGALVKGDGNLATGKAAGAFTAGSNNIAFGASAGTGFTVDADGTTIRDRNGTIVTDPATAGVALTDTVAIGNGALVAANRSVAFGAGANATLEGSVALGAGSVANTAAGAAGYVPTGADGTAINATTSTLAALSIGDAANGQLRQITGVAAGSVDTDAVNVSQLKAVGGSVTGLQERAVKYDWTDANGNGIVDPGEVDFTRSALQGSGGTVIANLADGAVNEFSTEAVNGSQLYGVSNSIANHLGDGATVNADGSITGPTYSMQGGSYSTVYD
ncbi:hypothetical protein AB4Z23_27310, partial [Agrobacterium sp. MCAB5]